MISPSTSSTPRLVLMISLLITLFAVASADTPIVRMARISLIEGEVSYRRAKHDNNAWNDASTNTPLGENDQVFTGQRGRAEVQLSGRNIVRLDSETSFKIAQFTTAVTQISLPVGNATFRIDSLDRRQFDIVDASDSNRDDALYFEVNTPTVSVTLLKTGIYRISVQENGTTEVVVRSGEAEVYNQELGTITLKKGRRILIEGDDLGNYQIAKLQDKDSWDRWNDRRDDELIYQTNSLSAQYVPRGIAGIDDLDRYGDWWYTSDYGYVWSPRTIATGWAPYRVGNWRWYSDWGWTWISTEPWGWTPYHYGSWSYYSNRWCWVPRSRGISVGFSWSPALVTWFGWGNGGGYNRGYNNGYNQGYRDARYDYVGWIPLAPGERYHNPHWGGGNTTIVNNTNIYGNGNNVNTRMDGFRNHSAPGGITRMDGRRFDSNRVVVANTDNTPIQAPVIRSAVTARGDTLRPVIRPNEPSPVAPAANPGGRQTVDRNVVSRTALRGGETITPNPNANRNNIGGVPTLRSDDVTRPADRTIRPDRANRDGNSQITGRTGATTNATVNPDGSGVTTRSGNIEPRNTDRNTTGDLRRSERPIERNADRNVDRPSVDRSVTPSRRAEENPGNSNTDRTIRPERPTVNREETRRESPPPDYAPRRAETERRETPSRQVERPSPQREEAPREYRREERPAPAHETRTYERPSPPPRQEAPRQEAPRQEAPPRAERQEAPRQEAPPRAERSEPRTERPSRDSSGGRRNQ